MDRLYKKLEAYSKEDYYPFHMPGHKRNPRSVDGKFPFERDITEIDGFDNLHHAEGIIRDAQNAVAELYGTKESFFSVNGSTAALLAAISACVDKGGQLLVARNCHKAVYNAIYLRDIQPTYIYPHVDAKVGINSGISPSRVERYLEANQDIQAVLITSPTYDGVVSDVERIAEITHRFGIPLIVDEAHGAHFMYSDYFPKSAVEKGADLVIQSFHKTLPSMTQTAVLHRCSGLVDREKIRRFLGIYQTSSPSYILMASLDACTDKMARDGKNMFLEFTLNLSKARQRLSRCEYIRLVTPEMLSCDTLRPWEREFGSTLDTTEVFDFDRSKILLTTDHSSLNGTELHRILREEFHLEMEMETENYVLAMATIGDTAEGFERLCEAVEEIDRRESLKVIEKTEAAEEEDAPEWGRLKQMMSISEAMDAPVGKCLLEESMGKISAEFVYLYPPGIPMIVPGEQITGLFVRNVRRYMEQGLHLQGLRDETNQTICVVKE